ncbi:MULTISPECIES: hypothetical protein [Polymorphospora]|uniref:Uncharacterized protein n=1 Tax=Polymorphospora lycopeni TaxID=3140240 RepID=A0ABV5CMF1_9ACTN
MTVMTARRYDVHEPGSVEFPTAVLPNVGGGGPVPGADPAPEPASAPGETTEGDIDDDGWDPDLDRLPQTD